MRGIPGVISLGKDVQPSAEGSGSVIHAMGSELLNGFYA